VSSELSLFSCAIDLVLPAASPVKAELDAKLDMSV